MELYTLDDSFRRQEVIDSYESLIWTERFNEVGDFELDIQTSARLKGLLRPETFLAMNNSNRVMQIETVTDSVDADHKRMMKVTGPSLESITKQRFAWKPGPVWGLYADHKYLGFPASLVRQLFSEICIEGMISPKDVYDQLLDGVPDTLYYPSLIPEPGNSIVYKREPKTLFEAMKDLMDAYWLGFRIVREPSQSYICWDVYTGNDRTSKQDTFDPVIFSPSLDTLQNTNELTDISNYKNVAMIGPDGFAGPFYSYVDITSSKATYTEPSDAPSGFKRRVVGAVIQVDNEDPDNLSPAAQAFSYGRIQLGQAKKVYALDGEVNQYGDYRYGKDYELGDRVEMCANDGLTNRMIVTEQIFVSDGEGERSYPTLTLETSVQPGTWASYNGVSQWADLGTTETWSTEP